jgi:hypothetical protein
MMQKMIIRNENQCKTAKMPQGAHTEKSGNKNSGSKPEKDRKSYEN